MSVVMFAFDWVGFGCHYPLGQEKECWRNGRASQMLTPNSSMGGRISGATVSNCYVLGELATFLSTFLIKVAFSMSSMYSSFFQNTSTTVEAKKCKINCSFSNGTLNTAQSQPQFDAHTLVGYY